MVRVAVVFFAAFLQVLRRRRLDLGLDLGRAVRIAAEHRVAPVAALVVLVGVGEDLMVFEVEK